MSDLNKRLVALANSLGGTEEDDIMAGVAEIEQLRAELETCRNIRSEAIAFLDMLANQLDDTLIDEPADCRAMAKKLREGKE